jgi:hypothetical protein
MWSSMLPTFKAADIQDRDGARLLLRRLFLRRLFLRRLWEQTRKQVQKIWADGAYKGDLVDWVQDGLDAVLDIVERDENQNGFEVLPRR